jgi:hypothetical protein
MERIASRMSATIIISGTLAGVAAADDELIVRQQIGDNYSYGDRTPRSEGSGTSDWRSSETETVDLYGPCDEWSIAQDQATEQQQVESFRFGREFES